MNGIAKITILAVLTTVFISGCASDNKNVSIPSQWKNIKEDRYAIYDVANDEENFIQKIQTIMGSLNPDKLKYSSDNQKTSKVNKLNKYF